MNVYVTKPFLRNRKEFLARVNNILDRDILTNQGPEVQEFESLCKKYLGVDYFHYLTNGTIALQLALKAFDIDDGEVITTPFSYVATTSSILWERCKPVFVDIEPDNFTIDPDKIEQAITSKTRAIMPVHVFGYACAVDKINEIGKKYNLPVIYDAAHAFGSFFKGRALVDYGDAATLSFHATKLFHTIEGGACIVHNSELNHRLDLIKRFGHFSDEHFMLGINGKQDEFNAAMGNSLFPYLNEIINLRKKVSTYYHENLPGCLKYPKTQEELNYNYAYFPVLYENENELLKSFDRLHKAGIFPRRYFYPSLNKLPYLNESVRCPVSEDICSRIACLPLYPDLSEEQLNLICHSI